MKRRYKLICILLVSSFLIVLIYKLFYKKTYLYLSINEFPKYSTYNYDDIIIDKLKNKKIKRIHIKDSYLKIEELLNMINSNENNINYYLKKASLITINIGITELNNYKKINNDIEDEYINDYLEFIKKITKLNSNIFIINLYDNKFNKINMAIRKINKKYKVNLIDNKTINKENLIYNYHYNIGYYDNKKIAQIIIDKIKNT